MNIKKSAIFLLSAALILSGCGKKEGSAPSDAPIVDAPGESVAVQSTPSSEIAPSPTPTSEPTPTATPSGTQTPAPTVQPAKSESLSDIANRILTGVNTPEYEIISIDADAFESYFFVPYISGASAISADALISSTAHSVCLVSLPQGTDAAAFARSVKANANPEKWICTKAESVEVAVKGNVVLLVMSDSATTNAIITNFNK